MSKATKKAVKEEIQPPPEPVQQKEEQPKVQQIEQEGFGRFEYRNGIVYEGQWKIIDNVKKKHGEGHLIISGSTSYEAGNEEYQGSWVNDLMEGYGVYKYTSGAIYSGEWLAGKQHGKGTYEFSNGTIYEGEWRNHKMHGEGYYIDKEGTKWEGEFVDGIFQSKLQKELKMEKMLKRREQEILTSALQFFDKFSEAFAKSDKKTFKENLLPFFGTQDEIKLYVKEPYPKFEDRPPDKWSDALKLLKEYTFVNVIRNSSNAKLIDPSNILSTQFNGLGQIVEFKKEIESRILKLVICNSFESNWTIVLFHDSAEPEKKGK